MVLQGSQKEFSHCWGPFFDTHTPMWPNRQALFPGELGTTPTREGVRDIGGCTVQSTNFSFKKETQGLQPHCAPPCFDTCPAHTHEECQTIVHCAYWADWRLLCFRRLSPNIYRRRTPSQSVPLQSWSKNLFIGTKTGEPRKTIH